MTIISPPTGVPSGDTRGVPRGRAPATSAGELARSERPGDRLAEARAGLACWHQRALSGGRNGPSAENYAQNLWIGALAVVR